MIVLTIKGHTFPRSRWDIFASCDEIHDQNNQLVVIYTFELESLKLNKTIQVLGSSNIRNHFTQL